MLWSKNLLTSLIPDCSALRAPVILILSQNIYERKQGFYVFYLKADNNLQDAKLSPIKASLCAHKGKKDRTSQGSVLSSHSFII